MCAEVLRILRGMKRNFVRLVCVHNDRVKLIILDNVPVSPVPEMFNRIFLIRSHGTSDLECGSISEDRYNYSCYLACHFPALKTSLENK